MANKLPRDVSSIATEATVFYFESTGSSGSSVSAPSVQTGASDSAIVPGEDSLSESNVHPWAPEFGSRCPVEMG